MHLNIGLREKHNAYFFLKLLSIFLLLILEPPILDPIKIIIWFVSIVIIIFSKFEQIDLKNSLKYILVLPILTLIVFQLPKVEIQEGSNFILFKNKENKALKSILPNQIYSKFQLNFESEYEKSKKKCKGNTENPSGCWRDYVLSVRPYSFSMDSIFINPKFSKIVQDIDFKNVRESRSGFLNGMKVDFNTNWYEWIVKETLNVQIPLFYLLGVSKNLEGIFV